MKNHGVQTVIFDLGNVLIDLDVQSTMDQMQELLGQKWDEQDQKEISFFLDEWEAGRKSKGDFVSYFLNLSTRSIVTQERLFSAWNAMLIGLPRYRIEMLDSLKEKYELQVLSNTNPVHISYIEENFLSDYGGEKFWSTYFTKVYFSHEMGCRKPEKEIYSAVVSNLTHDPKYALFIDDRPENVEAAMNMGLSAEVHRPDEEIADHIERIGL